MAPRVDGTSMVGRPRKTCISWGSLALRASGIGYPAIIHLQSNGLCRIESLSLVQQKIMALSHKMVVGYHNDHDLRSDLIG